MDGNQLNTNVNGSTTNGTQNTPPEGTSHTSAIPSQSSTVALPAPPEIPRMAQFQSVSDAGFNFVKNFGQIWPITHDIWQNFMQHLDHEFHKLDQRSYQLNAKTDYLNKKLKVETSFVKDVQVRLTLQDCSIADNSKALEELGKGSAAADRKLSEFCEKFQNNLKHMEINITNFVRFIHNDIRTNENKIREIMDKNISMTECITQLQNRIDCPGCHNESLRIAFDIDAFKRFDIVFSEQEKYHPHAFVDCFVDAFFLDDGHEASKCKLFVSLVDTALSPAWKRFETTRCKNFQELLKSFYREFWSPTRRSDAWNYFITNVNYPDTDMDEDSEREMRYELLKWIKTFSHHPEIHQDQLKRAVYAKLPEKYRLVNCLKEAEGGTLQNILMALSKPSPPRFTRSIVLAGD